jgi:hypothetical protein
MPGRWGAWHVPLPRPLTWPLTQIRPPCSSTSDLEISVLTRHGGPSGSFAGGAATSTGEQPGQA